MEHLAAPEPTVDRQVFAFWSIRIPASFEETFVHGDDCWHAWDPYRSVSLTSILVTDGDRLVSSRELLRTFPRLPGDPVETPPGLQGWAVVAPAGPAARASRVISGALATEGRLLIATLTGDDLGWATSTWLSIRLKAASSRARGRRRD